MMMLRNVWKLGGMLVLLLMMFSACNQSKDEGDSVSLEQHMDEVILDVYGANYAEAPGVSVMVARHGQPLFMKAYGVGDLETGTPLTTQTNLRMASVSKQFTSMATYLLIEHGALSFDTILGEVFEGLAPAPARVTVGQLLHHTSGLMDYESLIPRDRTEQVSDADVLEMIRDLDTLHFEPGTQYRYSNTGFCLLSLVVEEVSGMDYRTYMAEKIFKPLGMSGSYMYHAGTDMPGRAFGYHPRDDGSEVSYHFADQSITSATKGDGCVYVSSESYLTWADALWNDAFPSSQYLEDLKAHQTDVRDGVSYSLGWFVAPARDGQDGLRLFHSGETTGFRNIVYHDTATGLSVSVFANRDDTLISQVFEELMKQVGETHPVAELEQPQELFLWMSSKY